MQKVYLGPLTGLVLLAGGALWGQPAPSVQDLAKLVEQQSQQLTQQNQLIQELTARVQALEAKQADTAGLAKGLSATADDVAAAKDDIATLNKKMEKRLALSKHIEGLKVTGDLRLREEFRNRTRDLAEPDNADRDRLMARLRLGLVWNSPAEGWELGVGLATGGADGRSANDTWGEDHLFETGDIRLDYAYASHLWKLAQTPLTLTLGQQRNLFVVTPLVWDDDLRPTGATLQYGDPLKKEYSGAFATAGAYQLYNGSATGLPATEENGDVDLFAVQGGYRFTSKRADVLAALAYRRVTANYDDTSPPVDTASPGLWHADQTEDFDVVDVLVDNQTRVGPVELRPYGQAAYNLGADGTKSQQTIVRGYHRTTHPEEPEDHALAWWLGLDATYGKLRLGYAYAYIGADAVFGPLRDSEYGITTGLTDTDIQGHKLGATWSFTPNFALSLNAYLLERIEGGSGNVGGTEYDKGATYQIETLYRF